MATPEGRVKDKIKKLLKSHGIWYYMPMQNGMGVAGIPDLICCYEGLFIGIETKAPLKNPTTFEQRWAKATANQQARMREIQKAGGIAFVADDVQQVIDILNDIKPLAEMNHKARLLLGARKWLGTTKKSIGNIMELLSKRKSEPCGTPPEEKQNGRAG